MKTLLQLIILTTIFPFFLSSRTHKHRRRFVDNDSRFLDFKFEAEPKRNVSVVGGVQLDCHYVVGNEKLLKDVKIEWKREGTLINERTNPRIKILSSGSLLLNDVTPSDEGNYQCVVHLTSSSSSASAQITTWTFLSRRAQIKVADLSKFDEQPVDRSLNKGQPTAFYCSNKLRPSPRVTWYHNDKPITSGPEFHVLPVTNTLEISSTQPRHEGVYKCAIEGAGKRRVSQTARLTLTSEETTQDLTFISTPKQQNAEEGKDILLECLATSKNRPEVRWLKDSRQLVVDGAHVRRVGISSLLIRAATVEDSGLYTCRVSDPLDSLDKSVAVSVQASPHITTRPQSKIALETADVELECLASGQPPAKVSWYKNGESIIASEYFVVEPNKLRILGLVRADQGVYQCLAENEYGSEQASSQLLIDAADSSSLAASSGQPVVSSPPLGLRTTSIGSRFIALVWDKPLEGNGNIMRYHVFFREADSDRERMMNSSTLSVTITSLQPSTAYILRVAAENEAGMGKMSEPLKVSTNKEQAVPGRVTSLIATALGPQTIEVRWDPPAGGQPAQRYRLFYSRDPPEENDKETQITTAATVYTLHGMDKYTSYLVRVEADGENGSGLSSELVKVRTFSDEPSLPPQNINAEAESSTSIKVTWSQPEDETVNGEITGYRLKYKTKARGSKGNTLVIDANVHEYTMAGLEPHTHYLIRMAVVNHNGTGPYSDWLSVDTPAQDKEERLLSAPREIRPHAGMDYIVISWLPPADETNLVRGYQIGWGLGVPDVEVERVGASVMQHKIVRLHPGRDYVVSLRAFNSQGQGFPIYETVRTLSRESTLMTEEDDHDVMLDGNGDVSTPLAVRAETLSSTSIRVSWTESDQNAFNTLYTVRYSTSVDGNQQRYVNTSETWVTIESLRPATEYEFAVRSVAGGFSTWSLATRNRTSSATPSSAPRDLTVLPAESGDPHSVSLHWQPPKYANGDIEEYLIYYTDRESLADKDWIINYVGGEKLSHQVSNLLPKASYFFKIQARNEKGYGPFSATHAYTPSGGVVLSDSASRDRNSKTKGAGGFSAHWQNLGDFVTNNFPLVIAVAAILVACLLGCVLVFVCCRKRSKNGYTSGKKTSTTNHGAGGPATDLWINPNGTHMRAGASDYMVDGLATAHLTAAADVDSPPPRYQHVQGQGTLSRSYHQSCTSLEGSRHRPPQVVYTGTGRHQPIAKIDNFESPYGSSSALGSSATPPLPIHAPPSGPPTVIDGYRTLRGNPPNSANALRSFTQLAGVTPPPSSGGRPVVVASGGKHVPVGRATAQPRVNVANIYSPYASCSSDAESEKKHTGPSSAAGDFEMRETPTNVPRQSPSHPPPERITMLQTSNSTEELNAQMENLDTMIDDLQALQHEFGVAS